MKKSILGSNLSSIQSRLSQIATMVIFMLGSTSLLAQVDCSTTMACNDQVQVSLDENCQALIAPDMILEDPIYDDSEYTVVVMMPNGNIVPNSIVNYNHVNMNLEVSVTLTQCGTSCWGNITVEDKLPPQILSCADYDVDCDDNTDPGGGVVPFPTASDACSGIGSLEYSDETATLPCSAQYAQVITRTWTVSDEQGNEAVCQQTINVLRADIMSIVFPPNYDDIDQPSFSCDLNLPLLPNGAPDPSVTGSPGGANCPNIQVYYEDVIFEICGASKKILRQWLVVDWCTGQERNENQIIKILDNNPPICTTPPDFVDNIPTDEGVCTGTYNVPPPIVVFECSDWDYYVSYKLRDEDGNPFEDPIQDNVTRNFDGTYTISELPQDTTWIIYTITDACGHATQCFSEVFISDQEAPTPVCEGYTVVGLEDIGWANLFAESIDDGSYDNCEVVDYKVRRQSTSCSQFSDLQFGDEVNFCCEDVGNGYVKVVMRAFDAAGNYNDCIVNVTVQDKIAPEIDCPANVSIQCDDDYENLSLTGQATGTDNCSVEITYSDNVNLNDCGLGTVTRTWTATDPQGREATCTQTITVGDNNPFNGNNISWPADLEVPGCTAADVTPELLNSFPTLFNTDCSDIAVSYEDDVFYSVPDYCIKVLRHWRVADWCNYDPQNPSYFEYTQKIGIYNTVAPTITSTCANVEIIAEPGDCEASLDGTIASTIEATDDCTPGALLKYSYTLDQDNNGTIDASANGNTIIGTYPSGTHRITWTVIDGCDNETVCTYLVTIRDNKAPTPICLGELVWVLGEDGVTEVWASDFNLKSEDTCTGEDNLTYAFDAAGNETSKEFTCSDVPNGISEEIPLRMYVFDADGNSEFCDVVLLLQDSEQTNSCDDVDGANGRIAGNILNQAYDAVNDIEVELKNMDAQTTDMEMTEEGSYSFDEISYYDEYSIVPSKNNDIKNGVNTLDLVKIQRHILGLEIFQEAYKYIAADVNNDEKITAPDLLTLRKVILGISSEFPNNNSWRFVPAGYEFADELDPFGFPEKIKVDEFYHNMMNADFVGVKVGDIDNSAQMDNLVSNGGNSTALMAVAPDFAQGEIFTVDFTANEMTEAVGMQFTLDFDTEALSFSTISSGLLEMKETNAGLTYEEEGHIAISWNDVNSLDLNSDDILFSISFKSKKAGSIGDYLSVSNALLAAESYNGSYETNNIVLETADNAEETFTEITENRLYQNTPNPFTTNTTIAFDLVEAGNVSLTVYDITGNVIEKQARHFEAGKQEFTVSFTDGVDADGVLYYSIETEGYQATRKMVIIK